VALNFSGNQVLFGCNPTEGIVALELDDDRHIRLYRRVQGKLLSELQEFRPIIWLHGSELLSSFKGDVEIADLGGELVYRALASFESWKDCLSAKKYLSKVTAGRPSGAPSGYLFLNDPIHQHLLVTGQTCFRGMAPSDVNRLQIDIETYCSPGFEFSNPEREEDRLIAIALSDSSGWETVLWGKDLAEPEMLECLNRIIQERDPDVIEGHNLFKFDLSYIQARAKRHRVALKWGRNGSEPSVYSSRLFIAERTIDYPKWEIYGRHIVDTWILSQFYDISSRELEGLGLKEMAQHFGLASDDRTYVEGSQISRVYDETPDVLLRYALDDVRETRALSALLTPSYFIQAQIFPYNFQDVVVRGNATKINSLFLREYLRQRHSLPAPPGEAKEFAGGYTAMFKEGVVKNVVHCDVTSLYPSIMLARKVKPDADVLDVFLPLLRDLRTVRVEAKRQAQRATSDDERAHHQALQTTFKILINSFYGYLGTSFSNFADFRAAGEITETGQQILKHMIGWLQQQGCDVIELDTDGIYFVPPDTYSSPVQAEALVADLAATLPEGIEVELDGEYPAMFSYKMKNYALLNTSGKLTIKGSGLRSRGLERFQRQFLRDLILLLLTDQEEQVRKLYEETLVRFDRHEFQVDDFCKTETLSESLASYRQKVEQGKRNSSALYELALKSGRDYRAGDPLSYYVTGIRKNVTVYESCKLASQWDAAHPDENVAYYKAKLEELYEKFRVYLSHPEPPVQGVLNLS
jgi:DNA polymerase elongation subunit (family B)